MAEATRPCDCGGKIRRKNPTGRWPTRCTSCREVKPAAAHRNGDNGSADVAADEATAPNEGGG